MAAKAPSRGPAAKPRAADWHRLAFLAAIGLLGGLVAGCLSITPPAPSPSPTSAPPATAAEAAQLVESLPEPAEVADCSHLATTARDFLHATAVVATLSDPDSAQQLNAQLVDLGDGYATRTDELACVDGAVIVDSGVPARPGDGASATELLEYVLAGGDTSYPLDDQPSVISSGGQP